MRFKLLLLSIAISLPMSARADNHGVAISHDEQVVLMDCMEAARDSGTTAESCIGVVADACMQTEEGQTTPGMVICAMREESFWDEQLNFVYGELRGQLHAPAAKELRDIQRQWITWRDATCALPISLYQGGTAFRPAMASCRMKETARRAIDLGALLDEWSAR